MDAPKAGRRDASLVLAGAGKMGGAMLRAWLAQGYDPRRIAVIEPHPPAELIALAETRGFTLRAPPSPPDILVLAIKPQALDEAAAGLAPFAGPGTLIMSILAGKTIANLAARLPRAKAIIRAMPNLAVEVGRGVTGVAASDAVTPDQRADTEILLGATGRIEWVGEEHLIDAVAAVSGSGPAYVFYLAECLAEAGVELGLPIDVAERLARATIEGAGELLHRHTGKSPAELRENVTSPGGTTAAALAILMAADGLSPLMERALTAARNRAAELSG